MKKIWRRITLWFAKRTEIVTIQRQLIEGLQKQLKEVRDDAKKYPNYSIVNYPTKNDQAASDNFFVELGQNRYWQYFMYYNENSILLDFRKGGKHEEFYRGQLDMIRKMQLAIYDATVATEKRRNAAKI
jgi:hypothetical protein